MTIEALTLATALLLGFVALMLVFITRVRNGVSPNLRRISAYDSLKTFTSRSIETGRPLHLSLGTGSTINASTADSLAGLTVLHHLAERSAVTGISPTVSMADPTVMLFAQNIATAAQGNDSRRIAEAHYSVRWVAPQPAAYAAGVMSIFGVDKVESAVLIGDFGDEYLLMGEAATQHDIAQIGGASHPNTLPFVYASTPNALLGEEIYAAGAYLQKNPAHIGSLLAQDTMRWIIVAIMLGGVTLATLGWW